jgi:hypothetical protein
MSKNVKWGGGCCITLNFKHILYCAKGLKDNKQVKHIRQSSPVKMIEKVTIPE